MKITTKNYTQQYNITFKYPQKLLEVCAVKTYMIIINDKKGLRNDKTKEYVALSFIKNIMYKRLLFSTLKEPNAAFTQ